MKIIEIANGRSDARPTDPKSVLEQRLADLEATVRRRQKDWLAARTAAAAEPQDNLAEIIIRERAARTALEQELADRRAQYERDLARANAVRAMVDEQIREAALEVTRARQAEASAAAAVDRLTKAEAEAVARLAEREAELATELSAVTETRDGLEQQLSYVESALASARQRHELAANELEQLTRREADLSAQYTAEAAARETLERRIAEVEAALSDAQSQHRAAMATAATRLAEREGQFATELASITARRDSLQEQLRGVEERLTEENRARKALEQAITRLTASAAAAEQRFRDENATLAQNARAEQARLQRELSEREAELSAELASITVTVERLDDQRRGAETALAQQIDARLALERAIADQQSAALDAEQRFRDDIAALTENGRSERAALETRLSNERRDHETRLADEQQQHRSAMATAATRLAEREAQFKSELASITATRDRFEKQLRDVDARLTTETESRHALEQAITELHSSAAAAEQHFHEEVARLAENARAEGARLEDQLSSERRDHEIRLAAEQQQHRSTMADAATRLAEREAQFKSELAAISARREDIEQQLHGVRTALAEQIDARAALEREIAEQRSAAADAEQRLRHDITTLTENAHAEQTALQEQLSRQRRDHESLRAAEQQQHRAAMAMAATRLAEREAQFKTELATITAARDNFEEQLRDVETRLTQETSARETLEHAIAELHSAADAAEQRFRAETAALAENGHAERARLNDQLSRERNQHQARLADEQQQHRSAMADAATRLAEREAHFKTELATITATRDSFQEQLRDVDTRLTQETSAREALEQAISDLSMSAAAAEQRFREETATLVESARADRARLEDQLSHERRGHETRLAAEQQQHRWAMATAATRLAEREAQLQAELGTLTTARAGLEQQLRLVAARLEQETETRTGLERAIAEAQVAAADAERRFDDEIAAITKNAIAERARLEDEISRERALGAERLAARGVEFETELERLSGLHATALAKVQASLTERDSLLQEQERASRALQARLDASEAENRRQFEQTPVPLVRCTRDGAVAGANHAFAALVGCRAPGELRDRNFAATLFESENDLAWLIERSANSTKTESIETTCIRKDGSRIAVRLSARPSASASFEIAAEDLTAVRVLEGRLREAHRMEAVGRVASEIATTCEKLLRDVHREAQRLLTSMIGSERQRDQADTLLDDVTLAGSILQQLVAFGNEQTAASAPVDVNTILRDLQPVLKQVAGDAIALELRKSSSPLHVDLNAERVERLLVNVASYGRQRMPHGGRLRIELSTVVVDGKFIAQYPNVRQGPHALITVTEVARPTAEGEAADDAREAEPRGASPGPRVDLGALQELISECGGHLWITAEPGGSMVVRMRLPLRAAWEGQANAQARKGLGSMTARLFGR